MKIFIFGAGVQGTLYGLRLAKIGHDVILIARGTRAQELGVQGAVIQDALTGRMETLHLSVSEALAGCGKSQNFCNEATRSASQ